ALAGPTAGAFLDAFVPFAWEIAMAGMVNSLSQLVLKIASPGVPDFYQGTELWDLHLVDPDNRQPVAFSARVAMLSDLAALVHATDAKQVHALVDSRPDGSTPAFTTTAGR